MQAARPSLDARAWSFWAVTVMIAASLARNPLYTALVLLVTIIVSATNVPVHNNRAILSPLRFALIVIPLSALFNCLTIHLGQHVLFRLPTWIPLLGGPVTAEGLVFGAINGLALTAIFASFAVFNHVTPVRDLVRITPRAFHEVGVVISIALTFIPQTMRSLERIRQAQAVRGHRMRGLRDWLPIVMPLLVSGLERSMGLAEAMVARGYGAVYEKAQLLRTQALLALGTLALLGGWLLWLFVLLQRGIAMAVMLVGAGIVLGAVWQAGRVVTHTVYKPRQWTAPDTLVVLGCVLTLVILLLPLPLDRNTLYYSPFPSLSWPSFDVFVGLGFLGLLVPAMIGRGGQQPI